MSDANLTPRSQSSAFESLLRSDMDSPPVAVCLASLSKSGDLPSYEKLQLSDELTAEFRAVVKANINKYQRAFGDADLVVCPYHIGSTPENHEVEYLSLDGHGFILDQIKELQNLTSLSNCAFSDEFLAGLRFYVIPFQMHDAPPLLCFRSYTPRKEVKRSAYFAALPTRGQLDRIREPLFLFDKHIDCISQGDHLYIFNKNSFERIFKFFEMVTVAAEATATAIVNHLPIANSQMFITACKSSPMVARKLADIASKDYIGLVNIDDLKKIVKERDLRVQFVTDEGTEKMIYDPSCKWEFFKLLNDDYLVSVMTGNRYEATGKRPQK